MVRPSATALVVLFAVSFLAVAHGRALEADPAAPEASGESAAAVALPDETVPTLPAETEAVTAEQEQGILRLPSHRRHHLHHCPCRHGLFHRHLWWARHHGMFRDAHRFHHGHGEPGEHRAALPAELAVRDGQAPEGDEVKPVAVAGPDPDRSLPDSDGEGDLATGKPFPDGNGDDAAVRAWRKEMLWRMFRHGLRHHHHHRHHEEEEEDDHQARGVKWFHHHHEDDDDEDKQMRKRIHHQHHGDDEEEEEETKRQPWIRHADADADDEDEVEEMVRRFRKAIMRRRFFHHGRRFHQHHHGGHRHHSAEDPEREEAEGGVMGWIKNLMNRF